MIITYLGDGSFRFQSGETVCLIDPQNNRQKASVILRTLIPAKIDPVPEEEVALPGEYEIQGVEIKGFRIDSHTNDGYLRTAFRINCEEVDLVTLGHMSDIMEGSTSEALAEPDILFVPVGKGFLDAEAAAKLIRSLEPSVVIPSFSEKSRDLAKVLGVHVESQDKFVFRKKELEPKQMRLVILDPKGN